MFSDHVTIAVLFNLLLVLLSFTDVPSTISTDSESPIILDPSLDLELVYEGISKPTDIEFLNNDDILVLEKNKGTVKRIVNGEMLEEPLLDVNVATREEQGMLGMAVEKTRNGEGEEERSYVFLYYTEAEDEDGGDPLGNRLYRYEINDDEELVNPKLLLDLPAEPGPFHNGGKVVIGPDRNLYVIIGDVDNLADPNEDKTQNSGEEPDGRSGILRIDQEGKTVNPLLGEGPELLDKYYAYGIRNGYGIDFDPLTGNLWDTENGPDYGDEINLVKPGFNSGWDKIQGFVSRPDNYLEELEDYGGKGEYSDPEFVWNLTSGPTALKFFRSNEYGKEYANDLFVGDYHNGYLYHFNLSDDRTSLALSDRLSNGTANSIDELNDLVLAKGFQSITDIEVGYDGYIYIVSHWGGSVWRIVPTGDLSNM